MSGIRSDVKACFACYKEDWIGGLSSGYSFFLNLSPPVCRMIHALTAYIFFAPALPVIAFGEQLERDTYEVITATLSADINIHSYLWNSAIDYWRPTSPHCGSV
ncbi:hypothetical protein KC19_5G122600 [Ceratodon purpureus]|uniref:Uncharacterized protein n=1 Tax=Ceratodon purpureus TaxID=3225 RepID=A0A8T0I224_CERPU|nr:hypothetical protein KC19_5G122600 [Ceratodon purpureus]